MVHPLDSTQLLWTWIVGAFFALLFMGFLRSFLATRAQIAAARAWPKVEGEIIQSEVRLPQAHTSDEESDARPLIRYRYRIGGEDHEGRSLALGAGGPMEHALAADLVAKYPVGRRVDVYYDQKNPRQSTLDPRSKDNAITDAAFAVTFGPIAFVLLGQGFLGGVPYLSNGAPMFFLLMPAATFLITCFSFVVYWSDRKQTNASPSWPTITGEITTSTVAEEHIEHKNDDGSFRTFTRYKPDIRFAYRVGERDYVGTNVKWGWMSLYASPAAPNSIIACYPLAKRVTVHYDPADPATAVIETNNGRAPLASLVFGGLWAVGGAVFLTAILYAPWTHGSGG